MWKAYFWIREGKKWGFPNELFLKSFKVEEIAHHFTLFQKEEKTHKGEEIYALKNLPVKKSGQLFTLPLKHNESLHS